MGFSSISFSLLRFTKYSYYPLKLSFILEFLKIVQILVRTFHFHYLWLGDHQMLVLFHFHFCDLHNIHIIFLSLLLFWNFKKSFKYFKDLPFALFMTWWPPFVSSISFPFLWFTQYLYYPSDLLLLQNCFKSFKCFWVFHFHFLSLDDNCISFFAFVIYIIFKLAFSHVIILINTNNDNMHWTC